MNKNGSDMVLWILIIAILGGIGYAVFEEYNRIKYLGEYEVQKFWKTLGSVIVVVAILFIGMVIYKKSNGSHGQYHDKNGREQIQYQGSQEQQKDLRDIDKYSDSHSNF
jgi:predicted negative regulator of RcsB-dependent stress response